MKESRLGAPEVTVPGTPFNQEVIGFGKDTQSFRIMQIFKLLSDRPLTLREIANITGIPETTVRRIVTRLCWYGAVRIRPYASICANSGRQARRYTAYSTLFVKPRKPVNHELSK